MNNIVDFYSERNVVLIDSEMFSDLTTIPEYQFRNLVVIAISAKGRKGWMDFGSLCYSKREVADAKTHACKVVASTLDTTLEKVFDTYVRAKLSTIAATSVNYYKTALKDFSDYYFKSMSDVDFNKYDDCIKAYEKYTQTLLNQKAELLCSVNTKGFVTLAKRQHMFAELICLFHNKDLNKFKSKWVILTRNREQSAIQTVSLEELNIFYNFNKKLFYALKKFLMTDTAYPFVFSVSDEEKRKIVHYPFISFIQTTKRKLLKDDGFLKNQIEVRELIDKINEPLKNKTIETTKSYYQQMYDNFKNFLEQSQKDKLSQDKAVLINYAVSAFAMCMYCESSINSSQLFHLRLDDLTEFQQSIKGIKLCVTKPRSGYKPIELFVAAPMIPLLENYKEFRQWALSLTNNKNFENLLFSLNTKLGSTTNYFEVVNGYSGSQSLNLRRWIYGFLPDFEWIVATVIRKSTSTYFYNQTESSLVVSKKLGNTPKVVSSHYIEASEEDFVGQVSNFFDKVYDEISSKYRKNNDVIDVKIDEVSEKTAIGGCKEPTPKIHIGFTSELEQPNCSNPSSCLFCENYVVHSDREDLRKLMSLKKILAMSDKNDEAIILTKRINEILKILYDKYPEKIEDFIFVAKSVELGEFDEYWQDHLNLLLELGVNFYG